MQDRLLVLVLRLHRPLGGRLTQKGFGIQMQSSVRLLSRGASVAAAILFAAATLPRVDITDAFRTPTACFLLTSIGEVYVVRGGGPIDRAFIFHDARNLPYRWSTPPVSFVQWQSEWLVADGGSRLVRFDAKGTFVGVIQLKFRAVKLTVSRGSLWAVSLTAANATEQLLHSEDGSTFVPLRAGLSSDPFESPARSLVVVAGSDAGDLYVGEMIGPPVVRRVWPGSRAATVSLAYSRSATRARMETIFGVVDDVSGYSLPLRDIKPLPNGEVAVLRNREDVRGIGGRGLALLKGLRADRYDSAGRHVATAIFPRSVHWLSSVTKTSVTGVSNTGDVLLAVWGKAIPGEIIQP